MNQDQIDKQKSAKQKALLEYERQLAAYMNKEPECEKRMAAHMLKEKREIRDYRIAFAIFLCASLLTLLAGTIYAPDKVAFLLEGSLVFFALGFVFLLVCFFRPVR